MSDSESQVSDHIRKAWREENPSGWFEPVYAQAQTGQGRVPWAQMDADPQLRRWLDEQSSNGAGKSALVIGCGLGDDAEELARHGYTVTAFDIAETAIQWARERFRQSAVNYLVADLFYPPEAWAHAFDLVLESRTVQALPYQLADKAFRQIAEFAKPGGEVWVICHGREPDEPRRGIPWMLSRMELQSLLDAGLIETRFDDEFLHGSRRFVISYQRPVGVH